MVLLDQTVNLQFSATNLTLIIVALISAVSTFFAARNSMKLQEIHVLVNSNLSAAKEERAQAIAALAQLNEKHAELIAEVTKTTSEVAKTSTAAMQKIVDTYELVKKNGGDSNSGEVKGAS